MFYHAVMIALINVWVDVYHVFCNIDDRGILSCWKLDFGKLIKIENGQIAFTNCKARNLRISA